LGNPDVPHRERSVILADIEALPTPSAISLAQGQANADLVALRQAEATSTWQFNPACASCTHNKIQFNPNIPLLTLRQSQSAQALTDLQTTYSRKSNLEQELAAANNVVRRANLAQDIATLTSTRVDVFPQLAEITLQYDQTSRQLREAHAARTSIMYHAIVGAKLRMDHQRAVNLVKEYNMGQAYATYSIAKKTYDVGEILKSELAQTQARIAQYGEPATLEARIAELEPKKTDLDHKIGVISAQLANAQEEARIAEVYNGAYPPLAKEAQRLDIFSAVMKSKVLCIDIIKSHMHYVIEACNNILTSIATMTIQEEIDEKYFKLSIIDNGTTLPIEMGSGFQRFVIMIALRIALTSTLGGAPQFIIIDEGFGCMDQMNRANVPELFNAIRGIYKFILVITHLQDLQAMFDHPIGITCALNQGVEYSTINVGGPETQISTSNKEEPPKAEPVPIDVGSGKVKCACGAVITCKGYNAHLRTLKHIAYT
jgi:DNA repair exonuclease SbcCD ATPase subunit